MPSSQYPFSDLYDADAGASPDLPAVRESSQFAPAPMPQPSNPSLARPVISISSGKSSSDYGPEDVDFTPDASEAEDPYNTLATSQGLTGTSKAPARQSPHSASIEGRARKLIENQAAHAEYVRRNDVPWDTEHSSTCRKYTDCGVFAATCARTYDPNYPASGTSTQFNYVKNGKGKLLWDVIVIDADTQPQPGDILWTPHHTEVYVGDAMKKKNINGKWSQVPLTGQAYGASLGSKEPQRKGSWKNRFQYIFRPKAIGAAAPPTG